MTPNSTETRAKSAQKIRLAELLGALSFALDLTEGQPEGHCIRSCWIGIHIGRELGLGTEQIWELYYTLLLKDLGCSSNAARICQLYLADDLAFKRNYKTVKTIPQTISFVLGHTGVGHSLPTRLRTALDVLLNSGEYSKELFETRCHAGADIARKLRFPEPVADGIQSLDEHWNGGGSPVGLSGTDIPVYARIALLSQVIDVFNTSEGPAAAMTEAKTRSGTWFDPEIVAAFERVAADEEFWSALKADDIGEKLFALEPAQAQSLVDDDYLDDIVSGFATVIDAKSPFTAGHSERVRIYTDLIAEELGIDAAERRWLRRAALLHDIGKLAISNSILDKPGKLDEAEFREIRKHPVYSRMILERIGIFADIAISAGAHHERLDGKGYPKAISGNEIDLATRIITVADVFDALTSDRPYWQGRSPDEAVIKMGQELGTAFDADCYAALVRALEKRGTIAEAA